MVAFWVQVVGIVAVGILVIGIMFMNRGTRLAMVAGLLAFWQIPVRWCYAVVDTIRAWELTRAVLVLTAGLARFTLVFLRLFQKRVATMQV